MEESQVDVTAMCLEVSMQEMINSGWEGLFYTDFLALVG